MSTPYVGEIRLVPYNFAPQGWMFCDGSILAISENDTLFNLIGTTYGGDGQQTFALPDLRGRAAMALGQGPGLTNRQIGEMDGTESVTLLTSQLPQHNHSLGVQLAAGTMLSPVTNRLAPSPLPAGNAFSSNVIGNMPGDTVSLVGASLPHENRQPFLTLNYIISLFGIFPSQ